MELVINIDPNGEAQAMHMDAFNLSFLGSMDIERASELQFNGHTQLWDILVPPEGARVPVEQWGTHPDCQGFASYEIAREVEVAWFNRCRSESVYPLSDRGIVIGKDTRTALGY